MYIPVLHGAFRIALADGMTGHDAGALAMP